MPKVSVVIPFYNNIEWLGEAVESVLAQTYNDFEIIVVNDGSKENTDSFLEKYKDKVNYFLKENGGAATARNLGIDKSQGEFIAFLDSDDLWLPEKLAVQVKAMEDSSAIWSYCGYEMFGNENNKIFPVTNAEEPEFQNKISPYTGTPTVMVRRDYLLLHPECRFNPKLKYGQDVYMWLTLSKDNRILAIPGIYVKVRMHGSNVSRSARKQLKARGNIWKCRKENPQLLIEGRNISKIYCTASELCIFGDNVINLLSKVIKSNAVLEIISKFLFVLPWCLFKIDRRISKR